MTHRSAVVLVALVIVLVAIQVNAQEQGTHPGTASPGVTQFYSFTPSVSGQLTATLSWDNQTSNLLLVLVCGTDDILTYGVAAGGLDRMARLESGLIGLNPCVLGVSTVDLIAGYRLSMQIATDQLSTPGIATLQGVAPASEGSLDTLLMDQTDRVLSALKARMR